VIKFSENISLQEMNTFKVNVCAKYYSEFESIDQLRSLLSNAEPNNLPLLVLGCGSNILFTKNFEGYVLLNKIKGIEVISETDSYVDLKCASGEIWDDMVKFSVKNNWGGIENLSLIPGTAGAAPIQNIGAYGMEISDVLYSVEAMKISSGELKVFSNKDCLFDYRDSIFKNSLKDQYILTAIIVRLNKNPKVKIGYRVLRSTFQHRERVSISEVRDKVIQIRKTKLPDPDIFGNAGSFFKNPIVSKEKSDSLQAEFHDIPIFETEPGKFKISAGWLIEKCDFKGFRRGNVGAHQNHALVIISYEGASGSEILDFANEIKLNVQNKFDVHLVPEVNIL